MAAETASVTQRGKYEPFELQVERGQIGWHSNVNIQGYNTAHGTSFRAVWEKSNDTNYVFPASALAMTFSSTQSETCTVRVSGLDDTYTMKSATVTFGGSTNGVVSSGTATFFRINAMQVISGTTTGVLTASNGGVVYAQINAGTGRSQASIYTVPLGYTFYLTRSQAFTTNNGAQYCTYRVYSQTITNGVTTPLIVLSAPFTQSYSSTRVVPRAYPEKTDVQWQLMQTNAAPGSIQLEGFLIKNSGVA